MNTRRWLIAGLVLVVAGITLSQFLFNRQDAGQKQEARAKFKVGFLPVT